MHPLRQEPVHHSPAGSVEQPMLSFATICPPLPLFPFLNTPAQVWAPWAPLPPWASFQAWSPLPPFPAQARALSLLFHCWRVQGSQHPGPQSHMCTKTQNSSLAEAGCPHKEGPCLKHAVCMAWVHARTRTRTHTQTPACAASTWQVCFHCARFECRCMQITSTACAHLLFFLSVFALRLLLLAALGLTLRHTLHGLKHWGTTAHQSSRVHVRRGRGVHTEQNAVHLSIHFRQWRICSYGLHKPYQQ